MCQTATALGILLLSEERNSPDFEKIAAVFTDASFEVSKEVPPGSKVRATAEKVFWRRNRLKTRLELSVEDGTVVAYGVAAGMVLDRA
jgi:hypothetical protein